MPDVGLGKAVAFAVPTILLIVVGLYAASYVVVSLLGLPISLHLPLVIRAGGGVLVGIGLAVGGWVFAYRSPAAMIESTYITIAKMFGVVPLVGLSGRTEPLVVEGPQKYSRNPLYFGLLVMVFGWAMFGQYTVVFVWAVAMDQWVWLGLSPFEERELRVLFGEQYERYAERVPMLVPFARRSRRDRTG